MKTPSVQAAHAILDYLMTKAGMTGKTRKTSIRVPHKELVPESEDYDDLDLVITIETDWEQTQDGEADFTYEDETSN